LSKSIIRQGEQTATSFFGAPESETAKASSLVLTTAPPSKRMTISQKTIEDRRSNMFAKAYEEGYALGLAAGEQQGLLDGFQRGLEKADQDTRAAREQALNDFVGSLQRIVQQSDEAMKRWYELAELEVGDLVIDLARKVMEEELSLSRESVIGLCKNAMSEVTHASKARIRCNPADTAAAREHLDEIKAASASVREIEVVGDATILGGCAIETDGGLVDATFDNKLEVFRNNLREAA